MELASGKHVFLATVYASAAPEGASGAAYGLFPGPAEVAGSLTHVPIGYLVAELD